VHGLWRWLLPGQDRGVGLRNVPCWLRVGRCRRHRMHPVSRRYVRRLRRRPLRELRRRLLPAPVGVHELLGVP
jgi:hypothetical protein